VEVGRPGTIKQCSMKPQDEHIIITASIHSHTGAYRAPNVPYVHCEAPSFEPDDSQDGEVFMVLARARCDTMVMNNAASPPPGILLHVCPFVPPNLCVSLPPPPVGLPELVDRDWALRLVHGRVLAL